LVLGGQTHFEEDIDPRIGLIELDSCGSVASGSAGSLTRLVG